MTVAALFVDPNGVYSGLEDVEVWDEARDARLYDGPWPVVAHPPCNRFSKLATFRRQRDGKDGGCFEAALASVREWGGVLEHPAHSLAWDLFDIPRPPRSGWASTLGDEGWCCQVDQAWYGHWAPKPTWLYVVGCELPALTWGKAPPTGKKIHTSYGGGPRQALRSATPEPFRDVLLGTALTASCKPLPAEPLEPGTQLPASPQLA